MTGEYELPEGSENKLKQVEKSVDQTTDIAKIIKQTIRLPNRDLFVPIDYQMHAGELIFSIRFFEQIIGPRARQLLAYVQFKEFNLTSLAKLNEIRFIFKLLQHQVKKKIVRIASIELHIPERRLPH